VAAPAAESRRALLVGVFCYALWGLTPALFIAMGRAGASPWDILAHRTLWSAPWAGALVLATGRMGEVRAVFAHPKRLGLLALSATVISSGWAMFVWAVNNGHNIEASVGYFITPLLNIAVGATFFRERINRIGGVAIVLATVGVALQAFALGHLPLIALFLATTFWIYGLIRKQIAVEAEVGLFVECLLLMLPGLAMVLFLHAHGGDIFTRSPGQTLLMLTAGPATVLPLALFSWTARRLPLSTFGFLQFISPSIGFVIGLMVGERLSLLGAISFGFIWAGSATFMFGALRASRLVSSPAPA